jgi:uncharacterized protein YdeI (YjbR/CyaY-like superfamily)
MKDSEKLKTIIIPEYLTESINLHPEAKAVWEAKTDAFRKDYLAWITAAKTEETRQNRIEEALKWIAAGKRRFWMYDKK